MSNGYSAHYKIEQSTAYTPKRFEHGRVYLAMKTAGNNGYLHPITSDPKHPSPQAMGYFKWPRSDPRDWAYVQYDRDSDSVYFPSVTRLSRKLEEQMPKGFAYLFSESHKGNRVQRVTQAKSAAEALRDQLAAEPVAAAPSDAPDDRPVRQSKSEPADPSTHLSGVGFLRMLSTAGHPAQNNKDRLVVRGKLECHFPEGLGWPWTDGLIRNSEADGFEAAVDCVQAYLASAGNNQHLRQQRKQEIYAFAYGASGHPVLKLRDPEFPQPRQTPEEADDALTLAPTRRIVVSHPNLQQKPKETIMTANIKIEERTFINGVEAKAYNSEALLNLIRGAEERIRQLDSLGTKPARVEKEIATLQDEIKALVAYMDGQDKKAV